MESCMRQGLCSTSSPALASSAKFARFPAHPTACNGSRIGHKSAVAPVLVQPAGQSARAKPLSRRSVVVQASVVPVTEPWWTKNNPPNMKDVTSVQALVDELASAGDRLVIVDFFAKWCGACRALFPKVCQIANDNPDIIVLKVEFDSNKDIVKALAIKVLPFFHVYRGGEGRVAAFSASVSKVQRLRDAVAIHNTPRCSLGTLPRLAEFPDVLPHPHDVTPVAHLMASPSSEPQHEGASTEQREGVLA